MHSLVPYWQRNEAAVYPYYRCIQCLLPHTARTHTLWGTLLYVLLHEVGCGESFHKFREPRKISAAIFLR